MRKGDLVRFWRGFQRREGEAHLGLLIEYQTWEKIATVLHDGEAHRVRAENVEKAGKKDIVGYKEINGISKIN